MIDLFDNTFSFGEFVEILITAIPFLLLHFIIGFGPGVILGMLIANWASGRGQPTFMEIHEENIRKAAEHNAQWNPHHDRWKR